MTCRFSFCLLFLALAGQAQAQPPVPPGVEPGESYHLMFVTSFGTFIDINENVPPFFPFWAGLPAADWTTTFTAHLSGLIDNWNNVDIFYKAVLSTQAETAVDRLDIQAPIYNTNGDLIATDETDLWDGSIANPVGYDQFGNAVPEGTRVWTGSVQDGTSSVDACGEWNNPSAQAANGTATESAIGWISSSIQSCSQPARLYGLSPVLTVPDSADFDGNDVVNGSDFLTWQQNFGTVGPLATHANGDANGDDQINDADLAVWESQYGSSPLSAIGAVPEPGSVLLVVVAGLFLFCHRVHREHGEKENHSFSASVSSVLSVAILFLLLPTATQAQPPVPPGVEPGESYHLMFVDSTDVFVGTFEFVPPFLPVFGGLDAADWTVTFYASQGGLIVGWNQTDIL